MTPFTLMTSAIWALLIVVTPQAASATDAKSAIPQLSGLDCNPTTVSAHGSTICMVSLTAVVPGILNKGGEPAIVALTWPTGSRNVPIQPGQSHWSVAVPMNNDSPFSVPVVIQARYQSVTKTVTVTILAGVLKSLEIQPKEGIGGNSNYAPKGTVTLSAPAPQGGLKVRLGGDSPAVVTVDAANAMADMTAMVAPTTVVIIPSAVTVPSGQVEASFPIGTKPVAVATYVMITASSISQSDADQMSSQISLEPPPPPQLDPYLHISGSLSVVPLGGSPVTVTAHLFSPAGPGTFVSLSYAGTGTVTGPSRVEIPSGHTEGKCTITVFPCVTEQCGVFIEGRYGYQVAHADLTYYNPAAAASTSSAVGQAGATPTVRWTTAPNATLKEATGRAVVNFLKDVEYRFSQVEIFPTGGTTATKMGYGSSEMTLPPSQYDVAVNGARVPQVPITPGTDTRLLVGALRIQANEKTRVEVWDPGKTKLLQWTIGNGVIGLPVGPYAVKIGKGAGTFADVMIEDAKITEFHAP